MIHISITDQVIIAHVCIVHQVFSVIHQLKMLHVMISHVEAGSIGSMIGGMTGGMITGHISFWIEQTIVFVRLMHDRSRVVQQT
jgi:hypothetical protein